MRLSNEQARPILRCAHQQFGADAKVKLFGSRLDNSLRGRDVDLLVETAVAPTLHQRALAMMAIERSLNLPVDIVAVQRGPPGNAVARFARATAQPLEQPT